MSRGLPLPVVRLLSSWYSTQNLSVRWRNALSTPFRVSNGVRQGGVLSPVLFSIYLDELLLKLESIGVGCFWKSHHAGALAYADDIVLLAPSASALRILLATCESHGTCLGLHFNPLKTQLINFRLGTSDFQSSNPNFFFCGSSLQFSSTVLHLGNKLKYNLCDDEDIVLKSRYLSRAANSLFSTFPKIGPVPLTYLFSSYCLALYGCELWNLSSPGLRSLEVILNKCLRRIWRLPSTTHTCILHRCAGVQSIFNTVHSRFLNFIKNAKVSSNYLVRAIFSQDLAYTPAGLNSLCGYKFLKNYSTEDGLCAEVLRDFLLSSFVSCDVCHGDSPVDVMLRTIATA